MRPCRYTRYGIHRRSNENYFDDWSLKSQGRIRRRGKKIVNQVDLLLTMGHEKPVQYLDLALKPSHRYMRADHVKFEVIRNLPPACAEHLIIETEMHRSISLQGILTGLSNYQGRLLAKFHLRQYNLMYHWYYDYLSVFREKFKSLDSIQRKTSLRGMLNAYRLLNVNRFSTDDYHTWIRECTSSELDPALTVELLETLGSRNAEQIFLLLPSECLETMVCHAKVMGFDFWGLWRGINEISEFQNPVSDYIYQGRNQLATLLLKYGFPHASVIRNFGAWYYSMIEINCTVDIILYTYIPITYHLPFRLSLIPNRPRLIMTIFMAFAVYDVERDVPVGSVATLVHVMRSVPDPYVLPDEIDSHLRPFIHTERGDDLTRACKKYKAAEVYDEDYTVYKPRTLKHLCRCVVRRKIADNLRLPEGINELGLPNKIKEFMLLEA